MGTGHFRFDPVWLVFRCKRGSFLWLRSINDVNFHSIVCLRLYLEPLPPLQRNILLHFSLLGVCRRIRSTAISHKKGRRYEQSERDWQKCWQSCKTERKFLAGVDSGGRNGSRIVGGVIRFICQPVPVDEKRSASCSARFPDASSGTRMSREYIISPYPTLWRPFVGGGSKEKV